MRRAKSGKEEKILPWGKNLNYRGIVSQLTPFRGFSSFQVEKNQREKNQKMNSAQRKKTRSFAGREENLLEKGRESLCRAASMR